MNKNALIFGFLLGAVSFVAFPAMAQVLDFSSDILVPLVEKFEPLPPTIQSVSKGLQKKVSDIMASTSLDVVESSKISISSVENERQLKVLNDIYGVLRSIDRKIK